MLFFMCTVLLVQNMVKISLQLKVKTTCQWWGWTLLELNSLFL